MDPFIGVLDGQGHKIFNGILTSRSALNFSGLIADLRGQVKNINFENVTLEGSQFAGIVAARMSGGSITNIRIDGTSNLSTLRFGGSLVGNVSPLLATSEAIRIENIRSQATVIKQSSTYDDSSVGGLIGNASPFLSAGHLYASPEYGAAVILKNAHFEGAITLNSDGSRTRSCGAIAGSIFNSSIEEVSSDANVTGLCEMSGGIVGELLQSNLNKARFSGRVFCENPNAQFSYCGSLSNVWSGGIAGRVSTSTIHLSVFNGEVRGIAFLGGIAGLLEGFENSPASSITQSFSSGSVILSGANSSILSEGVQVGGIFGAMVGPNSSVSDVASNSEISVLDFVPELISALRAQVSIGGIGGGISSSALESGRLERSLYYGSIFPLAQSSLGGILGMSSETSVEDSFWNQNLNPSLSTEGDGSPLSTDEMMTASTFGSPSKLRTDRWLVVDGAYPHLRDLVY